MCPCLAGLGDQMVAQGIQNPFLPPDMPPTPTCTWTAAEGTPGTVEGTGTPPASIAEANALQASGALCVEPDVPFSGGTYVTFGTEDAYYDGTQWLPGWAPSA
jgi:hypothetical protein